MMIRACPHCHVKNRVPPARLSDTGHCGSCKKDLPPLSEPVEADTALFSEITRDARVPVLVDFRAPWCGPCKSAAPEVAKAAKNLAGKAIVLKVNIDENPVLANQFGIRSIPNFAVFKNGVLSSQQPGLAGHRQLEQMTMELN